MAKYVPNPRFLPTLKRNAQKALENAAIDIQVEAKRMLSKPGRSGRVASSGPGQRGKPVSKPGDPPAVQTGNLRRSVQVDLSKASKLKARVGTNVEYAIYLEVGTRQMAARPWLRPSLRKSRKAVLRRFTRGNLLRGTA